MAGNIEKSFITMPRQSQTIKTIQQILNRFDIQYRLIKIHGSRYQEAGLPDLMILIRKSETERWNLWVEIKSSWSDKPTKLQQWNVEFSLRDYDFITGYVVGDEFKTHWTGKAVKFEDFLKKNIF